MGSVVKYLRSELNTQEDFELTNSLDTVRINFNQNAGKSDKDLAFPCLLSTDLES